MDTLAQFLDNVSPATVESERLGDWKKARKESFSGAPHRAVMAHHEIEKDRFKFKVAANERRIVADRRRAEEKADADRIASYKQYQAEKRAS